MTVVEGHVSVVEINGSPEPVEDGVRVICAHIVVAPPLWRSSFERFNCVLGLLPGPAHRVC
ncbi:hypothetical protein [Paraburkholderia sp. HD33-4]|uniref:hypothetical protein n=1 Tax=Paraburkholderia sp. HD33-4 TaxID=2883242 RepID=UPI001F1E4453|nr:hypothetical protein [Paraburkholderia sp. HD33-4]